MRCASQKRAQPWVDGDNTNRPVLAVANGVHVHLEDDKKRVRLISMVVSEATSCLGHQADPQNSSCNLSDQSLN